MSKKLIGQDIGGKTFIVECEDRSAVMKAQHAFAKAGIPLESYDKAVKEEADRLVDRPDDKPKYRF